MSVVTEEHVKNAPTFTSRCVPR